MSSGQRTAEAFLIAGGACFIALIVMYPITMIAWLIVSFVICSFFGTWLRRINER